MKMPVIALDYDDTFSDNPQAWVAVAKQLVSFGYVVIGVTLRNRYMPVTDDYTEVCERVIYCAGNAKQEVLALLGYNEVIWIDDNPKYIIRSYAEVHGHGYYVSDEPDDLYTPMVVLRSDPDHAFNVLY